MTTLQRYLLKEITSVLGAVLIALLLLLTAILFLQVLRLVAVGQIQPHVLFELWFYQMMRFVPRIVPPAFFFSVIFVLGRLHRDSEMTALAACGIGPRRLYLAIFLAALPVVVLAALLSLVGQPWGAANIDRVKLEQKGQVAELAGISPGRFNEYSKGDIVFYCESVDNHGWMHNVFVQSRQQGAVGIISADSAYQMPDPSSGDRFLMLLNGLRYEGTPGQQDFKLIHYDSYLLRLARLDDAILQIRRSGLATGMLLASASLQDRAELQDRLSYPLAVLTLTLMAIPLSRSLPRQGTYGRLVVAILLYAIFLNLQGVSRNWMESGITPGWLGTWWLQAAMLGLAGLFSGLDSFRWRRVWQRLGRRQSFPG
ncbi:MAG: LPS export ABC transporter permease LptF [Pseudomonadota bacterium]